MDDGKTCRDFAFCFQSGRCVATSTSSFRNRPSYLCRASRPNLGCPTVIMTADGSKPKRLLCSCSKQDVVEPVAVKASEESWFSAAPAEAEPEPEKLRRKSTISGAMTAAREKVSMSHDQASKWASHVSQDTQKFLTARGWCGSITVSVGLFAVKISISLPVGGAVAIDLHWSGLFGRSSECDGYGAGHDDAEEKNKVPTALKKLADILISARKALPKTRITGATLSVAVDLTCWGIGMEIEASIEVASIEVEDAQMNCFCDTPPLLCDS